MLVSETTGRATERSISYGPASLLALAGRAKPMSVWSALEPRNRTGLDSLAAGPVPLIGRDRELGHPAGGVPAGHGRAPAPAGHPARPARHRQEPAGGRARPGPRRRRRPGHLAPGPLLALGRGPFLPHRRRGDLLGPGRDRQGRGRHPRDRLGRPGRPAPVPGGRPRHGRRPGRHRVGHVGTCAGWSARGDGARRRRRQQPGRPPTRRSPPGGASCTGWPPGGRWSWSWRTCTGPTTPCSTSSRSCWSRPGRRPWTGTGGRCAPGPRRRPRC